MKSQINLSPTIQPQWPRLHLLVLVVAFALSLSSALVFYSWHWQSWRQAEHSLHKLEQELSQLQSSNRALSERLAQRPSNNQILANIGQLEQRLSEQELLLSQLQQRPELSSEGFSRTLVTLAEASQAGLWLDRIDLNHAQAKWQIQGQAQTSRSIYQYLQRLNQSHLNARMDGLQIEQLQVGYRFQLDSHEASYAFE